MLLASVSSAHARAYAPMNTSGKKRHPVKAVIAGGIAGAMEAVISYPTEYVKTNLQLFEDKAKMGPIQCARETIAKDGVRGLYRGLPSLLWFSVPKVATRFFAFETLKNLLQVRARSRAVRRNPSLIREPHIAPLTRILPRARQLLPS